MLNKLTVYIKTGSHLLQLPETKKRTGLKRYNTRVWSLLFGLNTNRNNGRVNLGKKETTQQVQK